MNRTSCPRVFWLILTAATPAVVWGDITDVTVSGVSSTQAIITYTAPDQNVCSVEVSQNVTYTPLVHDVDPLIFNGANLDSRPGSISYVAMRTFVAGKRDAEVGLDGRRYSRALQALTPHYFRVTCGLDQVTGTFSTTNIPLGAGYFDPVPVDPAAPGVTAWPGFYGRNRSDSVIDPQTGLKIQRGTLPQDAFDQRTGLTVYESQDMSGGTWVPSSCASATACINGPGSGTLVNSTGNNGFLFLSNRDNTSLFQSKSYQQNASYDWVRLNLTAWCSGPSCATAADQDRTVSVCLTVNRVSCESAPIDQVLRTGPASYAIGGTNPILLDWTNTPAKLNMWELWYFSGTVNVTNGSAQVTSTSGDVFSIWWTAGSQINLNGVNYTIQSIQSPQSLTLASAWTGATGAAQYSANNTGFLIKKNTGSTDAISIGQATFDYGFSVTLQADSSGLQLLNWTCSPVQQDLGGGVMGRLCVTSQGLYAVESATGIHRSLGGLAIYVSGQYPATGCPLGLSSAVFDSTDPNTMYCLAQDVTGRTSIFSLKYYGNFSDIGPYNLNSYTYLGQTCNTNHSNQPCVDQVNLAPPPNHLEGQLAAYPDWALAPTGFIAIGGRQGARIGLFGNMGTQNSRGWEFAFDPATMKVVSAMPTFRYWPARWAGIHSWNNIQDPNFIRLPIGDLVTQSQTLSGYDTPGVGPYGAQYLAFAGSTGWNPGSMPAAGQACPAQPPGSPIAPADWPAGSRCVHIQVDGETCDPSPGVLRNGTVSSGASLGAITVSGTVWTPWLDGKPIIIGGTQYTFHYLTASTGTITPPASAAFSNQPYILLVESTINSPNCGNPAAFYLQDAAVQDVLMLTAGNPWSWLGQNTEFMRLIVKNGTDWWLERGYKGQAFQTAWPANTMLWQYQTSCEFQQISYEACDLMWNFSADPQGQNAAGNTVLQDAKDVSGHTGSVFGAGFGIDAKPYPGYLLSSSGATTCAPETDWTGNPQYPCYFVRQGAIPAYRNMPPTFVTSMPAFGGLMGIGVPNGVDSHPTADQINVPQSELDWFLDARPLNGGPAEVGTVQSPGVNVTGYLWKFTYAQRGCSSAAACSLERKLLPTLAAVNRFPLLDISRPSVCLDPRTRGPGCATDLIGTSAADWFKYCIAERAGECRANSAPGDLYVNAPISQPYCDYPGIAVTGGGTFDPCIGPAGAYTHSIVQIGFGAPGSTDWTGSLSRVLTHGLMRYRWFTPYWNVRTFDDASWLFWRADWLDGVRGEWMAAQLLPYPQSDGVARNDFIPVPITVTPSDPSTVTAEIEFGYAENGGFNQFFCTSRQEVCVKGNQAGNIYNYAGERPQPVACATSCIIQVPAISQRVLYYRILFFDANRNPLSAAGVAATIVP